MIKEAGRLVLSRRPIYQLLRKLWYQRQYIKKQTQIYCFWWIPQIE
jgi:hypothetical protein